MDEQSNGIGNSSAPPAQSTQTEDQAPASPPSGQEHEGNKGTTTSPPSGHDDKDKESVERIRQKAAHLESENAKLKKEMEELSPVAQTFEELKTALQNDPNAWEAVRQAQIKQGRGDIGSYESHFGTSKTSSKEGKSQEEEPNKKEDVSSQSTSTPQPVDMNAIRAEIEWNDGIKEFNKRFPEFDPANVTKKGKEEILAVSQKWKRIAGMAEALRANSPGMSWDQALIDGYYALPENREKYVSQIKEEGKMAGQAEAYAQGAATASGVAGSGTGGNTKKDYVDREEEAVYKAFGLTKEQYLSARNKEE